MTRQAIIVKCFDGVNRTVQECKVETAYHNNMVILIIFIMIVILTILYFIKKRSKKVTK